MSDQPKYVCQPDLMTLKELTDRLGLGKTKVDEMQRHNELPFPTIRIGGRVMFHRQAYFDWLSQFEYVADVDHTPDSAQKDRG